VIIVVGSTRAAKVEGVRAAIEAIASLPEIGARFRDAAIEPVDVSDVAPAMPMTRAATIAGARARATAVLQRRLKTDDGEVLGVGVEGGVDPAGAHWLLEAWAVVTDGTRWTCGSGGAVLLPDAIGQAIAGGEELGDVVDRLAGAPIRGTRGAWGLVTHDLVGRSDAFKVAVIAALAPFYNPALYQ
jgi:inosine/xanthosine triphosphatase